MAGLNMGLIKAMPIPIPPMELQREFASRTERRIADAPRALLEIARDEGVP